MKNLPESRLGGNSPVAKTSHPDEAAMARVMRADRLFFERRPERIIRLRRAFGAEIADSNHAAAEMGRPEYGPGSIRLAKGEALFVVIRKVTSDFRLRYFCKCPKDADTDLLTDAEIEAILGATRNGEAR